MPPTGPRVLVVEDNDDAREMVATCLGMRATLWLDVRPARPLWTGLAASGRA